MAVSEREWQKAVIDTARACGWMVAHFHDSRRMVRGKLVGDRDAAGFPDLTLAHPVHGVAFAELKREKGRVTPEQGAWIYRLKKAGARVYVWRPSDWPSVFAFLKDGAAPVGAGYPSGVERSAAAPLVQQT